MFLLVWWVLSLFFPSQKAQPQSQQPVVIETSQLESNKIDSDKISMDVRGLRISNIELKDYHKTSTSSDAVSLLDGENNFIEIGLMSTDTQTPNINTKWDVKENNMVWKNGTKVVFERDISVQDYVIKISDTIKNNSKNEVSVLPYVRMISSATNVKSAAVETGGVVYANSDLNYANWVKLNKKSYAYSTVRGSAGFADQYWETIASIDANDQTISLKKNGDLYFADTSVASVKVGPGDTTTIDTYVFAGPRIGKILNSASDKPTSLVAISDSILIKLLLFARPAAVNFLRALRASSKVF